MAEFVSARQAGACIRDGDMVGVNAFVTLANPRELTRALAQRYREEGAPRDLTVFCASSYGAWDGDEGTEEFVESGAVKSVVMGFYNSAPRTVELIEQNRLAAYNLPLGCLSHMIRAAAGGHDFYLSKIGLNLFVDPQTDGRPLNAVSKDRWVEHVEVFGEHFLKYRCPKFDVALIKASSADQYGNISFEDESVVADALTLAHAVRANRGKVIVEVTRQIHYKHRPWDVIIPGSLVDYICVCPENKQVIGQGSTNPLYAGDRFVTPWELTNFAADHATATARDIIARRAVREIHPGQMVNLGVGIPEGVGQEAARLGILPEIALTVESGPFGGMPASGIDFGSSVGAMSITSVADMFDFYDGGGLDVAFIGFLQVGRAGDVNGHASPGKLSGIGGFANITQSTGKVVFCGTFTAGGLEVSQDAEGVHIIKEGRIPKFVEDVSAVSFSAKNAHATGQEVLYVTERCVFRLGAKGLELVEVYPGIDLERDILLKLPFWVGVALA